MVDRIAVMGIEKLVNTHVGVRILPLYTTAELCRRWGLDRRNVSNWKRRFDDFPKPVEGIVLGAGPYYAACDVEKFEQGSNFNPNRRQGNPDWIDRGPAGK